MTEAHDKAPIRGNGNIRALLALTAGIALVFGVGFSLPEGELPQ